MELEHHAPTSTTINNKVARQRRKSNMYLNKTQELGRNFSRAFALITLYATASALLCFLIEAFWFVAFNETVGLDFIIPFGSIVCGVLVILSLPFSIKIVDGNIVLMTVDPLNSRKLENGQTNFNEYSTGIHILWPWEIVDEEMDIEKDIVIDLKPFNTSCLDDDVDIEGSFTLRPDIRNLSLYKANGDNHKDRVKNVTIQAQKMVIGLIESKLAQVLSDDIRARSQYYATAVSETINRQVNGLCSRLAVICNDVTIGNIDLSEDTKKARRVGKVQKAFDKAVADSDFLKNMPPERAMQHLRIISDQSKGNDIVISGIENLQGLVSKEVVEALKKK